MDSEVIMYTLDLMLEEKYVLNTCSCRIFDPISLMQVTDKHWGAN